MAKSSTCMVAAFVSLLVVSTITYSETPRFNSDGWKIQAKESRVVDHLGRTSLYLKDGIALVQDSHFTDGVIEFDLAVTAERGFCGVVWRAQDFENYEEFYIRPHQSGNPDANQYTPVFHGTAAWQLYHGEGYGAPVQYNFNQWIHFKVIVSGKHAEIYIEDMETPALFIQDLKHPIQPGKVGLSASFAPAHFSNFSFTPTNNPPLKSKPKATEPTPAGTVMSWLVSTAFEGKSLDAKYQIAQTDKQKLTWKKLDSESTGITNLARLQGVQDGTNTVFARLIVQSDRKQVMKIKFGFSDEVKVYFNDRLLYGGIDTFQSRDYRFLGTIGLFDELYLPLNKGMNELWFAVTEDFGGWGIKALFENLEGITIKE